MLIYIICPVRNASSDIVDMIRNYVVGLKKSGHSVHFPNDDVNQDDATGLFICEQHLSAMRQCDRVDIFWDVHSSGSHFDLGMAFALKKIINPIINLGNDNNGKSYWKVINELSKRNDSRIPASHPMDTHR